MHVCTVVLEWQDRACSEIQVDLLAKQLNSFSVLYINMLSVASDSVQVIFNLYAYGN